MTRLLHFLRQKILMFGLILAVLGCAAASVIQSSGGVRVSDIRFAGQDGTIMSALLYMPPNARPATPAPAILAVHGYYNSRETQDAFAIEFARRGFVVLAIDQTGHGYSSGHAFQNGFGGPDGLRYLRSLPFVDKRRIGLEGHSMGGWTVARAAEALPDGYRSLVLVGSSVGKPFAPEGTTTYPRNLALIEGKFDEFAPTMWGAKSGFDVGSSPRLMTMFGTSEPVRPGQVYGSIAAGTSRVYYAPEVSHAGVHFSPAAVAFAADWFNRTLGNEHPVTGQIWYWKEAATLVALIGFVLFVAGAFETCLRLPPFASLRAGPDAQTNTVRTSQWSIPLSILLTALLYLPLITLGSMIPNFWPFTQSFTTAIAFWGIVQSALLFAIARWHAKRPLFNWSQMPQALGIALAVALIAYALVALTAWLFTVDYRFWILGLKPLDARRFWLFLAYLPFFMLLFALLLSPLRIGLASGGSALRQYGEVVLTLCGGFVLFLAVEYAPLFLRGTLLNPTTGLYTILAIQFVPILGACAMLTVFTYRRTGRILPGALLCAFLVTWYITAGQAIQGAGMPVS